MYKQVVAITMISPNGEYKIINMESDLALIILSIFGLGWIKLFVDGRIMSGIINILLSYTIIGMIFHGVYLGVKPETYVKEMISKGYKPEKEEDAETIRKITGLIVDVAE